jgi:Mu-like prophage I protein.
MKKMQIPFFRLGTWVHPYYETLEITQRVFDDIIKNFESGVLGRKVFVRLGHDGYKETFGDAEAVGWVEEIRQEGDLLIAIATPASEDDEKLIEDGKYRYASAEYSDPGVDRETGNAVGALLSAIALTNEPFLTKLPEATMLAVPPGKFFLDYQLAEENKEGNKVEKILEAIKSGFAELKLALSEKPAVGEPKANTE